MIKENVSLRDYAYYKIGGPARFFLEAKNVKDLIAGIQEWNVASKRQQISKKIFILGAGTNILVSDDGFDGLVIRYNSSEITLENNLVRVGSGTKMADLNSFCIDHSLSGLEWSGGLPGTVGGAIFGNAGAFGGETKDRVSNVMSLDTTSLSVINRSKEECQFDYRMSIFKKTPGRELILSASFSLMGGEKQKIAEAVNEKIKYRKDRQPLELPSAGSTFKNVPLKAIPAQFIENFRDKIKEDPFPVIPAAVFLAAGGLKGFRIGDAQISEKHPNFIVNCGAAKSDEVLRIIDHAIRVVNEKFQVKLEPEVIILE